MNNLSFPIAEQISEQCLSLPMNPFLSAEQLLQINKSIEVF
jgi:dTDP-4-amino-4,6-dideoxygalactose transaminase